LIEKALAITSSIPTFQQAAKLLHAELLPGWKNAKHGQQWINTVSPHRPLGAAPSSDASMGQFCRSYARTRRIALGSVGLT